MVILIGYFAVIILVVFIPLAIQEANLIYLLFGTLTGAFTVVVNYWLNMSSNMRNKEITNTLQSNQEMDYAKAQSQSDLARKMAETAQVAASTANTTAKTAHAAVKTTQVLVEGGSTVTQHSPPVDDDK